MNDIAIPDDVVFEPIGDSSTNSFSGRFDGQGFSITNLRVQGTPGKPVGLFGHLTLAYENSVQNLRLQLAESKDGVEAISQGSYAGALAGVIFGRSSSYSIKDVAVEGPGKVQALGTGGSNDSFTDMLCAGALAGAFTNNGIVEQVQSNVDVTAESSDSSVIQVTSGGLIGCASSLTLKSSSSTGVITAQVSDEISGGVRARRAFGMVHLGCGAAELRFGRCDSTE